jgi:hypothetical protein
MTRLMAISQTISQQATGATVGRLIPEALTLTAACVWLLNGLHARPEDGPAARRLMDAALPLSEAEGLNTDVLAYNTFRRAAWQEEEDEGEEDRIPRTRVPYIPNGCVFFRRLMIGEIVPRLRIGGTLLAESAFKFWFDGMTIDEVKAMYQRSGVIPRSALAARRPTNKGRMPIYTNLTGAPEPTLFDLQRQGHKLPPPVLDNGSDIEDRSSPPPDEEPATIDTFLTGLWRQFIIDVIFKAPNPRGNINPSYLKLSADQRREAKDDIFKNLTLSDLFTDVAYRNGSTQDWTRAFKWLFPEPGFKTTSAIQNYPSCPYFKKWMNFIENPDDLEVVTASRQQIWKKIKTLRWIPDAQQDKMWSTKAARGFTRWPDSTGSSGRDAAAPRILLWGNGVPVFNDDV